MSDKASPEPPISQDMWDEGDIVSVDVLKKGIDKAVEVAL
jgi:hypothetical protein